LLPIQIAALHFSFVASALFADYTEMSDVVTYNNRDIAV